MAIEVMLRRGVHIESTKEYLTERFGISTTKLLSPVLDKKIAPWVLVTQFPTNHRVVFNDNVCQEELLMFMIKFGR